MRLLFPSPVAASLAADLSLAELAALYEPPAGRRSWVRANFVSTLDGAATGADGRSGSINNHADRQVFGLLRALADVLLVGAGTVAAEGYRPVQLSAEQAEVRAASGRSGRPVLAVVSRSLDLPERLLDQSAPGDLVVVGPSDGDPDRTARLVEVLGPGGVIEAGSGWVDPALAVAALSERGWGGVLCEGGPMLLATLVAADALDELCLTWSPLTVGGDHPRILNGVPVDGQWSLGHLLEQDSSLISRWVRSPG